MRKQTSTNSSSHSNEAMETAWQQEVLLTTTNEVRRREYAWVSFEVAYTSETFEAES